MRSVYYRKVMDKVSHLGPMMRFIEAFRPLDGPLIARRRFFESPPCGMIGALAESASERARDHDGHE